MKHLFSVYGAVSERVRARRGAVQLRLPHQDGLHPQVQGGHHRARPLQAEAESHLEVRGQRRGGHAEGEHPESTLVAAV